MDSRKGINHTKRSLLAWVSGYNSISHRDINSMYSGSKTPKAVGEMQCGRYRHAHLFSEKNLKFIWKTKQEQSRQFLREKRAGEPIQFY